MFGFAAEGPKSLGPHSGKLLYARNCTADSTDTTRAQNSATSHMSATPMVVAPRRPLVTSCWIALQFAEHMWIAAEARALRTQMLESPATWTHRFELAKIKAGSLFSSLVRGVQTRLQGRNSMSGA